jgi:hypothetical protein
VVQIPTGARSFLFSTMFRPTLGPTLLSVYKLLGLFSEIQRLRCNGDNSAPSSAEVRNQWSLNLPLSIRIIFYRCA